MNKYFNEFLDKISLSNEQRADGETKYKGVIDCLAKGFYDRNMRDSDKILFGSFKTRTQVLPMGENQDVDVVFKISEETYTRYKTRPGDILQKVRKILQEKYTTTKKISAWGKVVLVDFAAGHHDVEVAPCFETEDGIFLIPNNYSNDVDWEEFDIRGQIDAFKTSNDASDNLTRNLVKLIKKWVRNTASLTYTSFNIVNDVIKFIDEFYPKGLDGARYDEVVKDYFTYYSNNTPEHLKKISTKLETARDRTSKAYQYEQNGQHIEATEECRKIFGDEFPLAEYNEKNDRACSTVVPVRPWFAN